MTSNRSLRIPSPVHSKHEMKEQPPAEPEHSGNGHQEEQPLRMYTEVQVGEMLQVSLSQLRKWRMKQYEGQRQGPPFRKIGRLVRYPEPALRTYINATIGQIQRTVGLSEPKQRYQGQKRVKRTTRTTTMLSLFSSLSSPRWC